MIYKVTKKESRVDVSDIDLSVSVAYDYRFDGVTVNEIKLLDKSALPSECHIGLIVGASGSGKTTNLSQFGERESFTWEQNTSIASHFASHDDAALRLHGCGLNSIRAWTQPRHTLSTGQGYRADIAATIGNGAVYDEFCSYLDPNTSKSLCHSINKLVSRQGYNGVVLATCRDEIADWLNPDWVFNCDTGDLTIRGLERRRPAINLEIHPCSVQVWDWFKDHHYLDAKINKGARCWMALWGGRPVAFYACLAQPSGSMRNAWRGSRLVVLPEYQGLGISTALTECVADIFLSNGKRFFAKTASELLGGHRERSGKWRATSKNRRNRKDYMSGRDNKFSLEHKAKHANRICYSHEYIWESKK